MTKILPPAAFIPLPAGFAQERGQDPYSLLRTMGLCTKGRVLSPLLCKALLAGVLALVGATISPHANCQSVDNARLFTDQIQPILTTRCLSCHAGDKPKGKLDLTTRARALKGGKSGTVLKPGTPGESLLFERLQAREMPPQNPLTAQQIAAFKQWIESGAPYAREPLVAASTRAGPDWWSLQPLKRTAPPHPDSRGGGPAWVRTPIDAFILQKLDAAGLAPAPEADRRTLIRRATLDLIGLPPTPAEIEAFVNDTSADAYERLIDRLLASPHYGERWGRHWLDVVRFGESHGYETNQLRMNAWPYRDYVIRAFNRDTPFPQFVSEQLAGDTISSPPYEGGAGGVDWLTQSATGFLVGGVHDVVGNQTPEGAAQQRMDDLDDMITATGTAFLGLTVNCARCHDHKFDPIQQTDYYGLQAIFAGVQHTEREVPAPDAERRKQEHAAAQAELARIDARLDELEPLASPNLPPGDASKPRLPVNPKRNVERFAPVAARFIRFTVQSTNNLEPCLDELEIFASGAAAKNVALARLGAKATASSIYPNSPIHRLEHIHDGKYGNSWSWISNEPGKGWVQIELPSVTQIDRIVWGRDREEKYKDRLAIEYKIEVAVEPERWQVVASSVDRAKPGSEARRLQSAGLAEHDQLLKRQTELRERLPQLAPTMKLYLGTFTQPGATHLLTRGDPMKKGAAVPPSALVAVRPALTLAASAPESERRLALARWIGHPENPLPARVMVNRVWHYHFGQGIVNTPSDFGYNGGQPSHPELLDWLASEYQANGWQLKPLHKLIMMSATYRQASRPASQNLDPAKIDANNRLLWHFPARRLEAEAIRDNILALSGRLDLRMGGPGYYIWEKNTNYVTVFQPKTDLGADEFRRMVYQFKPRTQQDQTFGAFDCPDAALVLPRRNSSTTALQALNLLNSGFIIQQAECFAERLQREAGNEPTGQAAFGFRLAFSREPSATELTAATALIRTHGTPAFCRAVYNANELVYLP
jgi:hypothetical protein